MSYNTDRWLRIPIWKTDICLSFHKIFLQVYDINDRFLRHKNPDELQLLTGRSNLPACGAFAVTVVVVIGECAIVVMMGRVATSCGCAAEDAAPGVWWRMIGCVETMEMGGRGCCCCVGLLATAVFNCCGPPATVTFVGALGWNQTMNRMNASRRYNWVNVEMYHQTSSTCYGNLIAWSKILSKPEIHGSRDPIWDVCLCWGQGFTVPQLN